MATAEQIIEGLKILVENADDGDTYCAAEHDILYGPGTKEIPEGQKELLEKLGWFYDDDVDCWARFT